jgi:uncharacterized membrane protein
MEGLFMKIKTRFNRTQRIRRCTLPLVALLAVVFLLVGMKAQAPAPEYTVTDLGDFEPQDVNSIGDVVGYSSDLHVIVWRQGVLTDLGTMGGSSAIGSGINDSGQIAGTVATNLGIEHFIYTGGEALNIGAPTENYYSYRINNLGHVANAVGGTAPFFYGDGAFQYLSTPGCPGGGMAIDLNDGDTITGSALGGDCGNQSAVLWSGANFQILPVPPGASATQPGKINSAGQVAGSAYTPNARAILWQPDSAGGYTFVDLGPGPDGYASYGQGLNDAGVTVGALYTNSNGEHGFVWDSTHGMRDLNALIPSDSGIVLGQAFAINNAGMIVARAPGGYHAYLLTPTAPVDTTPPTISRVVPTHAQLWPPNNKMVPISLSVDATDLVTLAPSCQIASVSSSEPGPGQWQTTGPLTLNLLASRHGHGIGRVYTIEVQCSDAAGNSSFRSTTVVVPRDQGEK